MLEDLKTKGFVVTNCYSKEEVNNIVRKYDIRITYNDPEVIKCWANWPKGLLQVLLERGFVNENELLFSANRVFGGMLRTMNLIEHEIDERDP